MIDQIQKVLGDELKGLLDHRCVGIPKELLHVPGPDFVDREVAPTDRPPAVMRNMQLIFNTGRLAGTGYMSILPVDQGINIRARPRSVPTRFSWTRKISSNSQSKAAATPARPPWACSVPFAANTRTRSR